MSNTTYLKNAFDAVKTFMTIGGQTVNNKPSIPSESDMLLRLRLNIEENLELTEAILGQSASRLEPSSIEAIHHMREAVFCIDRMIKQCADKPVFGIEPNMKEVLDALIDIEYVNIGAAITFGFDLEEGFKRVHESNMSKFEDGKAIKNNAGKVIKGKYYQPPVLDELCQVNDNNKDEV